MKRFSDLWDETAREATLRLLGWYTVWYERNHGVDWNQLYAGGFEQAGVLDEGPGTLGTGSAWQEYNAVRSCLVESGLKVAFTCGRCGNPRMMEVEWHELAAIAAEALPQWLPDTVRAALSLDVPTRWWRDTDGAYALEGFPCHRCGNSSGPIRGCKGVVGYHRGLPRLSSAEARSCLRRGRQSGIAPYSLPAVFASYRALRAPYELRDGGRRILQTIRAKMGDHLIVAVKSPGAWVRRQLVRWLEKE